MAPVFKRPSPSRMVYFIVMLSAIAVVAWYIRHMLAPYDLPTK